MKRMAWVLSALVAAGLAQGLCGCRDDKDAKKPAASQPVPSAAVSPAPSAAGSPSPMPHEQAIARYSPGVFKVIVAGNYDIEGPTSATLFSGGVQSPLGGRTLVPLGTAQVELDYRADLAAGKVVAADHAKHLWLRLAADPGKYLFPGRSARRVLKSYPFASGTAFAVSREGILITNAHVVAAPTTAPDVLFRDPIVSVVRDAAKALGEGPPEEVIPALWDGLKGFFADQSRVTARFDGAVLVTQFDPTYVPPPVTTASAGLLRGLDSFRQASGEITDAPMIGNYQSGNLDAEPVAVVRKGQIYPGKDIAILRACDGNLARYRDKLICLPLGDSDLFQLGPVLSMGYPGAAVDDTNAESASYRVIPMPGEITARLDTVGGWTSFHLTALINHGHSGGPTLDKYGQVIGINVAGKLSEQDVLGNPAVAIGYNVSIPIDLAREMLAEANIRPDGGPVTKLWLQGQDAYWAGRYAEAADLFAKVADAQAAGFVGPAWAGGRIRKGVNYYVAQALDDARKRAGLPASR